MTTFDGNSHRPHKIIPTFPICVRGKVINIKLQIVDANLDYNLLLGWNSPHEGRIFKVYPLDYSPVDPHATLDSPIPLVDNPRQPIENLGVGMYSSLMGTFDLPTPIARLMPFHPPKSLHRKSSCGLVIFQTLGLCLFLQPH